MRTKRLTLRRARSEDAKAVFAYRSRHDVGQWLTRLQIDAAAWSEEWMRRIPTTLAVEHADVLIGDVRIVVQAAQSQAEVIPAATGVEAELMWAFHPDWHGCGYGTEAAAALVRCAFGELGLRRVVAFCFADNTPSWKIMERVGMRRESHQLRAILHRDGTWRDSLAYGMLAEDFELGRQESRP